MNRRSKTEGKVYAHGGAHRAWKTILPNPKSQIQNGLMAWSGYHAKKDPLRAEVWSVLKQQNAAIRDPVGHIPAAAWMS